MFTTGQVPTKLLLGEEAMEPVGSRPHAGLTAWVGSRFPPELQSGPGFVVVEVRGSDGKLHWGNGGRCGRARGTVSKWGCHQDKMAMAGVVPRRGNREGGALGGQLAGWPVSVRLSLIVVVACVELPDTPEVRY